MGHKIPFEDHVKLGHEETILIRHIRILMVTMGPWWAEFATFTYHRVSWAQYSDIFILLNIFPFHAVVFFRNPHRPGLLITHFQPLLRNQQNAAQKCSQWESRNHKDRGEHVGPYTSSTIIPNLNPMQLHRKQLYSEVSKEKRSEFS